MKHRATILVADDDRHVRRAVSKRLAAMGCRVVEAPDGLAAIACCHARPIDLLILDHGMPHGDGRSVARLMRKETDAPIVFLSAHDRGDFRSIVMQLPNTYFLAKPLEPGRLTALVSELLDVAAGHARENSPEQPGSDSASLA